MILSLLVLIPVGVIAVGIIAISIDKAHSGYVTTPLILALVGAHCAYRCLRIQADRLGSLMLLTHFLEHGRFQTVRECTLD